MLEQGLDAIERNSRVQSHLIEDLLDFAGIRFGKMRIDVDAIPPARAVESAAEVVQTQAINKGVELHLHVSDREAHVLADESRLQQVVWNLLSNAIKFTPTGGRIDVNARVVNGQYEIAVTDTGRGISPEFLPQIFERFSQQESGTGKSFAGLGIGLTIVKHLVDIHHGTIEVESAGLGQGRDLSRAAAAHRAAAQRSCRRTRARDSSACARWWSRTIRMPARSSCASSPTPARRSAMHRMPKRRWRTSRPRCPTCWSATSAWRSSTATSCCATCVPRDSTSQRLPAIALTAFSRVQDRADALAAGFQAHLAKPVKAEALISAVANLAVRK